MSTCIRGQDARDTINQGWKYELMGRRNGKTVLRLKRRRADDWISRSLAYKHKNSSKYKDIQDRPVFTANEKAYWYILRNGYRKGAETQSIDH